MGDEIRGITRKDTITWALFRDLARGDFRHDFDERVPARDLITSSDEERFFEIAKRVSNKGSVWLRTNFKKYISQTIFTVLSPSIDNILPAAPPSVKPNTDFYNELQLLEKVGIDFASVKTAIQTAPPGTTLPYTFTIPNIGTRSYTLRSSSYRLGPKGTPGYSQNQNITQMFREVTGGKQKFALIVDASGGLPLTELLNTTLQSYSPGGEFYIIENIENAGDSATKLSNLKTTLAPGTTAPTVRFLQDKTNTVVYPLWTVIDDQKSNVYSSLKIVLNRIGEDEVEANISIVDKSGNTLRSFQIPDLSNTSNVKNATLYALAVFLDQGLVSEAFVYTLIKRMGDWCQALSLLDLDRVYNVLDINRESTNKTTTLRDMLVDTEIGIVTNDRILLAFSILLGLNVFFTTAMDTARLVYFKNNNDVPSGPALDARSQQIYTQSNKDINAVLAAYKTEEKTSIANDVEKLKSLTDIVTYISSLKNVVSNVGKLRDEFETLQSQYFNANTKYNSTSGIDRFNAANTMASVLTKIELDIDYNLKTLNDISRGLYPGSQSDTIRLESLRKKLESGARITKSVEVTEAKEILLGIRDDLYQCVNKTNITNDQLASILRINFTAQNERIQTNYDEILSVIPLLRNIVPAPQKGGGLENITKAVTALKTRTIRIIPPGIPETTSTVNIYTRGSKFIDEKLRAYTVVDEFIVTEDDYLSFSSVFDDISSPLPSNNNELNYLCLKYLLLQCDILDHRLEKLRQSIEGTEDTGATSPGTIEFQEFDRIKTLLTILVAAIKDVNKGALDFYRNSDIRTDIPGGSQDVLTAIKNVRIALIQIFDESKFPVVSNVSELTETKVIEENTTAKTNYVKVRVGYYREAIAQRVIASITPAPSDTEKTAIGNIIEQTLERFLLSSALDDQQQPDPRTLVAASAENISTAVADAIDQWLQFNRPQMSRTNIVQLIKTSAAYIRGEELKGLTKGGSHLQNRRPLYTNVKSLNSFFHNSGKYERLRKRARTRTTPRLRKSSRKSKTRRQRNNLDTL